MARPLRIEFPGAVYHVTSRGNARTNIFEHDSDRKLFLKILQQVVDRFNWLCHAYCLMDNHYHLLVETPEGNLSAGMRQLNGVYTQAFNRTHNLDGHLFKGRYKSVLVEKDSHLLELCRYVVLNPVRAGMVKKPEQWAWSSYHAMVGQVPTPEFLTTHWLLDNFSPSLPEARSLYSQFVQEGVSQKESPWEKLSGQILLGTESFVQRMKELIVDQDQLAEIPKKQRLVGRPTLKELFGDERLTSKQERNDRIRLAHRQHGYTLKEISEALGLHYTTISKIINHDQN